MARRRRIAARALNIRLHEHTDAKYQALIESLFSLRQPVTVRGDTQLLIQSIETGGRDSTTVSGAIAKFTNIEVRGAWLNIDTLAEAKEREVSQLKIPENLKPNYKTFYFSFDANNHILIFESTSADGNLSPMSILALFSHLIENPIIKNKFGDIEVDIVSDEAAIKTLFKIHKLQRVDIWINRPNPDGVDEDLEKEIHDRLQRRNAKSENYELVAAPGKSIKADEALMEYAKVASRNGQVSVIGKDQDGNPDRRSSSSFPQTLFVQYDPDKESSKQAFARLAYDALKKLARNS